MPFRRTRDSGGRTMRNPPMPDSVRIGTTRCAFAGGWASSQACRKETSRTGLRRPWTRRSIRANRTPTRTGPRGTGRWNWVDGDFDCRRNRSGKWPAVPERGRLTALAATRACWGDLAGSRRTVASTSIRRGNCVRAFVGCLICTAICLSGGTIGSGTTLSTQSLIR